jgi:hypothetical protein
MTTRFTFGIALPPEQVGERIGVDVPASSDFVGAYATGLQQVVHVLA